MLCQTMLRKVCECMLKEVLNFWFEEVGKLMPIEACQKGGWGTYATKC